MIKRMVFMLASAVLFSPVAGASTYCDSLAGYAYKVAVHRDEGVSKKEFMAVIEESHGEIREDTEIKATAIVEMAFKLNTPPSQYRKVIQITCEKSGWENGQ